MTARELSQACYQFPEAWDRFWFGIATSRAVSRYRVAIGLVAALHFGLFFTWVPDWLSGDGWFDLETGRYLIGEGLPDTGSFYRWSPLFLATSPAAAYAVCATGLLASLGLVLGLGARVAPWIAWMCMLTIHHRAPWLSLPGEILMTAGLFYLLIDPGRTVWTFLPGFDDSAERRTANLMLRCGQVHLLIWLVFSVMSMSQYSVWWNGRAVSLLSEQMSSWIGVISSTSYLGQLLTLAIPALQIAAVLFLTRSETRVIGLACLALFAGSVAVFGGDPFYGMALMAMGTVFLPETTTKTHEQSSS